MAINMYQASVPVFTQMLGSLQAILKKGEAHVEARKIDPNAFMTARLAADMIPLPGQVYIATDQAKGAAARLTGSEVPSYPDTERSFAELDGRIKRTLDYVKSFKPEQFEGAEDRDVTLQVGPNKITWKGSVFLFHFALPNLFFHVTTAYAILRHNGVEIGKRDFIGTF